MRGACRPKISGLDGISFPRQAFDRGYGLASAAYVSQVLVGLLLDPASSQLNAAQRIELATALPTGRTSVPDLIAAASSAVELGDLYDLYERYVDMQLQEADGGSAAMRDDEELPVRRDGYVLGQRANLQGFVRHIAITAEQLGAKLADFRQQAPPIDAALPESAAAEYVPEVHSSDEELRIAKEMAVIEIAHDPTVRKWLRDRFQLQVSVRIVMLDKGKSHGDFEREAEQGPRRLQVALCPPLNPTPYPCVISHPSTPSLVDFAVRSAFSTVGCFWGARLLEDVYVLWRLPWSMRLKSLAAAAVCAVDNHASAPGYNTLQHSTSCRTKTRAAGNSGRDLPRNAQGRERRVRSRMRAMVPTVEMRPNVHFTVSCCGWRAGLSPAAQVRPSRLGAPGRGARADHRRGGGCVRVAADERHGFLMGCGPQGDRANCA